MQPLPIILGPYGGLIFAPNADPLWGIARASEQELDDIALLIRLLPGQANFLWREVRESLVLFFGHEQKTSAYLQRIATIVAKTGWEIWEIQTLPYTHPFVNFEAKKAELLALHQN
jgi:hypothetical protein